MVEWGRLLSGYWGEILSRRFESCPPRHIEKRARNGAFSFLRFSKMWYRMAYFDHSLRAAKML